MEHGAGVDQRPPPPATVRTALGSALWCVVAAVGGVGYVLARSGFGTYPSLEVLLQISDALPDVAVLRPDAQYLQYSPAGPFLAWLVGASGATTYQLAHVAWMAVAVIVAGVVVVRRAGRHVAALAAVSFLTSQSVVVISAWWGSYDVFTWAFGTAIVLTRSPGGAFVAGVVAAAGTFEQTLISVGLLSLVTWRDQPVRANRYLAALGGVLLGRGVLTVWLRAGGADHDRLAWLRDAGASDLAGQLVRSAPWFVLTAFGGAWVVVIGLLRRAPPGVAVRFALAFAAIVVPCAVSEDQTRIFALVGWPLLLALVLRVGPGLGVVRTRRIGALALLAGLVVPPVYVWAGTAHLADHHLWRLLS